MVSLFAILLFVIVHEHEYDRGCRALCWFVKRRAISYRWEMKSSGPSVFKAQCPSRIVLDRIADKWTALIIQVLANGTRRYAALQREIGGISQKMLTQTLRSLERDGLVLRKVHPVVPPKVEYSLTRLGRTLIDPLHALCRWSEKHLPELQANRERAGTTE